MSTYESFQIIQERNQHQLKTYSELVTSHSTLIDEVDDARAQMHSADNRVSRNTITSQQSIQTQQINGPSHQNQTITHPWMLANIGKLSDSNASLSSTALRCATNKKMRKSKKLYPHNNSHQESTTIVSRLHIWLQSTNNKRTDFQQKSQTSKQSLKWNWC